MADDADTPRQSAEAPFARSDVWSAEKLRAMIPRYARPEAPRFAADVLKHAKALRTSVRIAREGVVHGRGLVATRDLRRGDVLIDATALYVAGRPPRDEDDSYVDTGDGYFQLRPWGGASPSPPCAAFYFVNEARGATPPSVSWKIKHFDRPMLCLRVDADVKAGAELLAVYNNDEDEEASAATEEEEVPPSIDLTGDDAEAEADADAPAVVDLTGDDEPDGVDVTVGEPKPPRPQPSRMGLFSRTWPRDADAAPRFFVADQTLEVLVDESVVARGELRTAYTRCKVDYGGKTFAFRRGAGDDVRGGLFPIVFLPEDDEGESGSLWAVRVEDIYRATDGSRMIAFSYLYSAAALEAAGAAAPRDMDRDFEFVEGDAVYATPLEMFRGCVHVATAKRKKRAAGFFRERFYDEATKTVRDEYDKAAAAAGPRGSEAAKRRSRARMAVRDDDAYRSAVRDVVDEYRSRAPGSRGPAEAAAAARADAPKRSRPAAPQAPKAKPAIVVPKKRAKTAQPLLSLMRAASPLLLAALCRGFLPADDAATGRCLLGGGACDERDACRDDAAFTRACLDARVPFRTPYARVRCCFRCCFSHWIERHGLDGNWARFRARAARGGGIHEPLVGHQVGGTLPFAPRRVSSRRMPWAAELWNGEMARARTPRARAAATDAHLWAPARIGGAGFAGGWLELHFGDSCGSYARKSPFGTYVGLSLESLRRHFLPEVAGGAKLTLVTTTDCDLPQKWSPYARNASAGAPMGVWAKATWIAQLDGREAASGRRDLLACCCMASYPAPRDAPRVRTSGAQGAPPVPRVRARAPRASSRRTTCSRRRASRGATRTTAASARSSAASAASPVTDALAANGFNCTHGPRRRGEPPASEAYLNAEFVLAPQGKGRACYREWEARAGAAAPPPRDWDPPRWRPSTTACPWSACGTGAV
ncbi:hypothetical protein SO694_000293102 [Aureococcus anophagefferens]|uniref:SET domain-containing protein n=1 Tax=Aureococcus anophagefferens TaxID=44056 RepID=A0ABR1FW13_AURAN